MWAIYITGIGLIVLLCFWFHLENQKQTTTDDLTGIIYLFSILFVTLTVGIYVGQVLKLVIGDFNPATPVTFVMVLLLCGWIYVGLFRHSPKAPEGLVYFSLVAVLTASVALILLYSSNAEVEDNTVDDSPHSVKNEKEMEKQHDLVVKQTEKETVELLHRMAMLNASTQLQLANMSLQATAVESDAMVQIAKTNLEKEVRIAELQTELKKAENEMKLKTEQAKASTVDDSVKKETVELKVELAKIQQELELQIAKANAEKEILLAQEATKQREAESKMKLAELEMERYKVEQEVELKSRVFAAVMVTVLIIILTFSISSGFVKRLRHKITAADSRNYADADTTAVNADTREESDVDTQRRRQSKFSDPILRSYGNRNNSETKLSEELRIKSG